MQAQQSYQVHSQQQGYQSKQPAAYQAPQVPMSGQHAYHPQPQQQQPPPPPGQYPVPHGHQGQQDQVHRQQTIVPQQYQQQQGGSQSQGRQGPYEGQQMPPPQQQQQQQQHQKHEQRPGTGLGYSQHYTVSTLLRLYKMYICIPIKMCLATTDLFCLQSNPFCILLLMYMYFTLDYHS